MIWSVKAMPGAGFVRSSLVALALSTFSQAAPAQTQTFLQADCIKELSVNRSREFRIPTAKAKAQCIVVAAQFQRLKVQILGAWRRIDDNGKEVIQTFTPDGIVKIQRFERIAPGKFKRETLTMSFEVNSTCYDQACDRVAIDGSEHSFVITGNRMHETWVPSRYLIETDWTRMAGAKAPIARPAPKAVSMAVVDNGRMCQIITIDRNGAINGFGKGAPISQRAALKARLPALKRQNPTKTFNMMCEDSD